MIVYWSHNEQITRNLTFCMNKSIKYQNIIKKCRLFQFIYVACDLNLKTE
jgi:hypothetical protein